MIVEPNYRVFSSIRLFANFQFDFRTVRNISNYNPKTLKNSLKMKNKSIACYMKRGCILGLRCAFSPHLPQKNALFTEIQALIIIIIL